MHFKKDPNDLQAEIHIEKAGYYMRMKQYEDAIREVKKCISVAPNHSYIHMSYNILGSCYTNLQNYTKAEDAFNKAIEVKPDFLDAHCNLGYLFIATGRHDDSLNKFMYVLRKDRNHSHAIAGFKMLVEWLKSRNKMEIILNLDFEIQLELLSLLDNTTKSYLMETLSAVVMRAIPKDE